MTLSLSEAQLLISLARNAIETYLKYNEVLEVNERNIPIRLAIKQGVFTSLYSFDIKELRGCIGFPYPTYPLYKAVIISAIEAAINDPRFEPITLDELNNTVIELSLLTSPEKIETDSPLIYPEKIRIGRDGLILRYKGFQALLLPQVAAEHKWSPKEFLSNLCLKAGLPPDIWLDPASEIFKFNAEIFIELTPGGHVVRRG